MYSSFSSKLLIKHLAEQAHSHVGAWGKSPFQICPAPAWAVGLEPLTPKRGAHYWHP